MEQPKPRKRIKIIDSDTSDDEENVINEDGSDANQVSSPEKLEEEAATVKAESESHHNDTKGKVKENNPHKTGTSIKGAPPKVNQENSSKAGLASFFSKYKE